MESDTLGSKVWFDPVGLHVQAGDTIRWELRENVHTVAAYHPDNAGHALRIPATAAAWDSGYLVNQGDHFEVTLTQEGVYDYYCEPHEFSGMVGRIVVGNGVASDDWRDVPTVARAGFPSVAEIVAKGRISGNRAG
jgi:plastocyanin